MNSNPDHFAYLKQRMEARYGVAQLQHPHPGIIGQPLTMAQAMYSMIPSQNDYAHLTIPYNSNNPTILSCEPLAPRIAEEQNDMDVD